MQQILLNTEHEEHTVQTVGTNRSLQRLLPFKTGSGDHGWHGIGKEEVREKEWERE